LSRHKLPDTRASVTRRAVICGIETYITISFYDYDPPRMGEIFIRAAKVGSEVHGMLDSLATIASVALQCDVPWETISGHWRLTRFGLGSGGAPGEYSSLLDGVAVVVEEMLRHNSSVVGEPFPRSPSAVGCPSALPLLSPS